MFRLNVVQLRVEDSTSLGDEEEQEALFDLVVSNPPYVLRKDLASLEPEISLYEDLRALDGGPDGLDVVLPIIQLAFKVNLVSALPRVADPDPYPDPDPIGSLAM